MKEKHIYKLLSAVLILSLIFASGLLGACSGSGDETTAAPIVTEPPTAAPTEAPKILNPLTGLPGYDEAALNARPVCVMINNLYAARPQWGLLTPDVVFETVAEGGITRMLWMYANANEMPEKVGSIRSARHYYIQLAQGYDAIFVHWGGSTYAYNTISKGVIDNIDGLSSGKYFDRDYSGGRAQEHTGFTMGSLIRQAISDKGYRTEINASYKNPFVFSAERRTPTGGPCETLSASFSTDFDYTYKYNAADGLYYSYLNDYAFCDSDGAQQTFTNVIFIYAPITSLNDSKGRVTLNFDGGSGVFATNGGYENITWKKGGDTDILKFYAADGSELQFNAGRSYIGIIPTGRENYTSIS